MGDRLQPPYPPPLPSLFLPPSPPAKAISVAGLALGTKGEGKKRIFFLLNEETRKQAEASRGRAWGALAVALADSAGAHRCKEPDAAQQRVRL